MGVPAFLLRKLYRRGSLRETGDGRFAFKLQNPLANATVTGPPRFLINGVLHHPEDVHTDGVDLASITVEAPWPFGKGEVLDLSFRGHLLRGGNRIHIEVPTKEFGLLEIAIEDRQATYCDLPTGEEE